MKQFTLEQYLEKTQNANNSGMFGTDACKESIEGEVERTGKSLYTLLGEYVERANKDIFFNTTMIQACWQLINKR